MPATSSSRPSPPPARSRSGSSWAAGKADCSLTCRSCHSNGRPSPSPSTPGSPPGRGHAHRPQLDAPRRPHPRAADRAACLETWATPHRQPRPAVGETAREPPCGSRLVAFARILRRRRPGRFKVARSLPLAALGSARPSGRRCRDLVNQPTPTRRDHMNLIVNLVGRLTAGPHRYYPDGGRTRCKLRLAVQRPRGRNGEDQPRRLRRRDRLRTPRPQTAASTSRRAARSPSRAACTTPSGRPRTARPPELEVIADNVSSSTAQAGRGGRRPGNGGGRRRRRGGRHRLLSRPDRRDTPSPGVSRRRPAPQQARSAMTRHLSHPRGAPQQL